MFGSSQATASGRRNGKQAAPRMTAAEMGRRIFVKELSLSLAADAIPWLVSFADAYELENEPEEMEKSFRRLAEGLASRGDGFDGPALVNTSALEETYNRLVATNDEPGAAHTGAGDELESAHYLKVVDAFEMPAWRWGEERKGFEKAEAGPSLAPPATSKARYLRDRFNVIKQVILRNEHFSPPTLIGQVRQDYMKLTSIKNLLGRQGGHFLIFGLLTRMQDGALYLEDLDDKVELDLSEATPESGLFTEGSFVLVDGDYTIDSIFKVNEMGHPPSERRAAARKMYGHHDFLGVGAMSTTEEEELIRAERLPQHETSFIILSDLHLDNRKIMAALEKLLSAYEGMDDSEKPSLFVLCGNFRSRPFLFDGESTRDYQELFGSLATLLAKFPSLLAHARFLLIPGPTDPWSSNLLPRPALPKTIVKALEAKVPFVSFGSNPCRVRYFSQEIVIFREDTMGRMMRNAVRMGDSTDRGADLRKALVQTILDQAHLAPLPLNIRPVLWDFDHSLRLYPMPTTLVLADKFDPYKLVYEDCLVFNPGSFARRRFGWSTYYPQMVDPKERMEESELPDDRD